jgi:site-specific recombinase XerD
MQPSPNRLGSCLRDYFANHLPRLRGMSPHTIHSYRDSVVLLLRSIALNRKLEVCDLDLADLQPDSILAFLAHLEKDRGNAVTTRNVRLAAIHAFFRYVGAQHPDHIEQAQRVLGIPFKRATQRVIDYLDRAEIETILATVDRKTADGRRDYALLATMFNTGARVQEIIDLRASELQLTRPYQLRLFGKECHSYCISFRRRNETTIIHVYRQAYDLAFSSADVLLVVRTGIGLGPYTDMH